MAARVRVRKTPTNLSLRRDLVERARSLGLNMSEILEPALERAVHEAERAAWLARNRGAIADFNERVQRDGVFSDDWRRF